ncbi:hypothetical protein BCR39DRAFT_538312 [Naematelia encephala]|uniref:CRAL-TRIO domain-containing protein n=1 Tax=Naematelia encephala TaxID=71784 RepID=A0A1Y2AXU9_9TREE|nr:hypothetical protein BCR39DRAFT_538312 [Naematelia encephala]
MPIAINLPDRFERRRLEFQEYLPHTERIQADLRDNVDELRAQEGWDQETSRGILEWIEDKGNIWRALRRNRYDPDKTHNFLLAAIGERVNLSLHANIPSFPPYSESALFYILPLPKYVDRQNRPIVVLTLREVARDENGGLDDLKEWTWWALEMVRRMLVDWWINGVWDGAGEKGKPSHRRGYGGEGCVLLIDAAGASYRNLEVEMLPTLLSVGHNNFPGIFESVFVVNAGWTHRSMWTVVKRILPRSALEKVNFLDAKGDLDKVFDLDQLPRMFGGHADFTFDSSQNRILNRYQRRSLSAVYNDSKPISRATSSSSIADIYQTARNTPAASRPTSRRSSISGGGGGGLGHFGAALRMTRSQDRTTPAVKDTRIPPSQPEPDDENSADESSASDSDDDEPSESSQTYSGHTPGTRQNPMQRIKSLTDFHLYLSPSRLAHIDLLSDSSDDETPRKAVQRRALRPVTQNDKSLSERRARPQLRLLGVPGGPQAVQSVRTYSDRLQAHHARVLEQYREKSPLARQSDLSAAHEALDAEHPLEEESNSKNEQPNSPLPKIEMPDQHNDVPASPEIERNQPVSAFSRDTNPWFGYPAIRSSSGHLEPRYNRRRKRDLAKTLLFLFMLRIQSWRDWFERVFGLNRVGSWSVAVPSNPTDGLMQSTGRLKGSGSELVASGIGEKDWIWMIIGFLLLRGTWTRALSAPLEALGLENVRNLLGLV